MYPTIMKMHVVGDISCRLRPRGLRFAGGLRSSERHTTQVFTEPAAQDHECRHFSQTGRALPQRPHGSRGDAFFSKQMQHSSEMESASLNPTAGLALLSRAWVLCHFLNHLTQHKIATSSSKRDRVVICTLEPSLEV
jgi:hypothetical protein